MVVAVMESWNSYYQPWGGPSFLVACRFGSSRRTTNTDHPPHTGFDLSFYGRRGYGRAGQFGDALLHDFVQTPAVAQGHAHGGDRLSYVDFDFSRPQQQRMHGQNAAHVHQTDGYDRHTRFDRDPGGAFFKRANPRFRAPALRKQ